MTKFDIEKLSKMAKFRLHEEEVENAEAIMEFLIADFDEIAKVDTKDTKPFVYAVNLPNRLRKDEVINTFDREILLQNAPDKSDGYFKVPKTVE
jgi:aspartyl-tRNA(Asn)/glutamyl-tRNA(Gln) amidotransferase subunit C